MAIGIKIREIEKVRAEYEEHVSLLKKYLNELSAIVAEISSQIPDNLRGELNNVSSSYDNALSALIQDALKLVTFMSTQIKGYSNAMTDAIQKIETVLSKMNSCYLVSDVANETIRGNYGSGTDRISNLTSDGYDPKKVQQMVNSKMNGTEAPDNGGLFESDSVTPYGSGTFKVNIDDIKTMHPSTLPPNRVPYKQTTTTLPPRLTQTTDKNSGATVGATTYTATGGAIGAVSGAVAAGVNSVSNASTTSASAKPTTGDTVAALATGGLSLIGKSNAVATAENALQAAKTGGLSLLAKSENKTARVVAGVLTGGASTIAYSDNPTAKTVTAIATGGLSAAANSDSTVVRALAAVFSGGTSLFFKR